MAHRYAGDALMKLGRKSEALERYLSAAIAEPYAGYPWRALHACCQASLLKPWTTPRSMPSARITQTDTGAELALPEKFSPLDIVYGTARIDWQKEHRSKRFPAGTKYRLTLEEEVTALRLAIQSYLEIKADPKASAELSAEFQTDSTLLDHLVQIDKAGLLEAHILFVRGDDNLAQDYAAYRAQHRQSLHDYLTKFYLHVQ